MSRDAEAIKDLIETHRPDIYERISRGDTKDQCLDFSEAVLDILLEHGEDAIMVQSRTREGEPLHHFLLWREGGTAEPQVIDPTVGQLYTEHNDVFIGTREELREMIFSDGHDYRDAGLEQEAREIFKEYWPRKLHLCQPNEIYDDLGAEKPKRMDKAEFQDKWNADSEFKVIQREKFTRSLASSQWRGRDDGHHSRY